MVKKMHASTAPAAKKSGKSRSASASAMNGGLQDSALAKSVKDSAQHIWLAGMGAFSKVQEEGTKAFEALVKEGQSLQRKTQAVAEEKIGEVTGKMTAMAGTVQAKANQNWDKLETIFEARTAKAMAKLGVPTAKDVEALIQRVDELAAAVAKLSRQNAKASAPVAAAPKAPRRRTAAKPLAVKVPAKAPAKRAARKAAAAA
jgi:poly(hydroxyalkanoate) granule-associated protein